ncbi:MAG: hypothetical protein DRN37_00525, partial [Thermoplasmata archaeon]
MFIYGACYVFMLEKIARFLLERKWWIATAESCTGGLLA